MSDKEAGIFVVVVGPSGAGKDSLIVAARQELADDNRFHFVRRVITRPADDITEMHEAVDKDEFERMLQAGDFSAHWRAHGLDYGIPASVDDALAAGRVVVANGSRSALREMDERFPALHVILVTADPAILAERLAARGREKGEAIAGRLGRRAEAGDGNWPVSVIENNGLLEEAVSEFVEILRSISRERRPG